MYAPSLAESASSLAERIDADLRLLSDRSLAICELLVSDREEMVARALSWALRELIVHDRAAVEEFAVKHNAWLAARVRREVRNKLTTGLKNPR
jgi:3-methyladenine DNA glycosylase AlkD